jgi:hypothetical protein
MPECWWDLRSSEIFLDFLILEDEADTLPRNVCKQLPHEAV